MSVCFTGKFSLIRKDSLALIISVFFLCSVPNHAQPAVWIDSVNSTTVGLYEKFEIFVGLEAEYINPYNPEEIDLRAVFTSPSSATWEINGFFDNYENDSLWKIRFSPNESGTWTYKLVVTDINGTDSTDAGSGFTATSSPHHGWLKVSPNNPHYLMHDNGTSFYGVGVYYPWNARESGLDDLKNHGANMFAYWNCTYDWAGNGGGRYLIESISSGLGSYDQRKCARIDQLLSWAEERDMKMMLAIWPHGYLRTSSHPWGGGEWNTQNPYNTICSVDSFFIDSDCWEYQKKQYRYIIARWGYSRAMGIWEIINEINGTSGWVYDETAANQWFENTHNYFADNDPYRRPTTGSKSGYYYDRRWEFSYQTCDVLNIHLYEAQAWPKHYPTDDLRSSLWNYVMESQYLWDNFLKPGIIGESGYTTTYVDPESFEYTITYHNALWASLSNGLSMTPVWWNYDQANVPPENLDQLSRFSKFVSDINFAHFDLDTAKIEVPNCDAYALRSDSFAFGWVREENGSAVGNRSLVLNGLLDGEYKVAWYNCWGGNFIKEDTLDCTGGVLSAIIPLFDSADIAFKVLPPSMSGVKEKLEIAGDFLLLGNSPEPFTNSTTISYVLPEDLRVSVKVYDLSGRLISTLLRGEVQRSGKNTLEWNAGDLTSGVYFYRVEVGNKAVSGKCILLR